MPDAQRALRVRQAALPVLRLPPSSLPATRCGGYYGLISQSRDSEAQKVRKLPQITHLVRGRMVSLTLGVGSRSWG